MIPTDILAWLKLNSDCAGADLTAALQEAGHSADRASRYVGEFLSLRQTPSPPEPSGFKVRPQHFSPPEDWGQHFPNALYSGDAGRHHLTLACTKPRVLHVQKVLSNEECESLIELSRPTLAPSTVVSNTEENNRAVHASRTSYGTHIAKGSSPLIKTIEKRLCDVFRFPHTHGEPLQVLNYGLGGEYKPHFDYFNAKTTGGQACIGAAGNRVATIIMYLNDVELGGATVFPKLGLSVLPVRGSAVYFDYAMPDGSFDPRSLHGGAPVLAGEKWIATKWVRQLPFL